MLFLTAVDTIAVDITFLNQSKKAMANTPPAKACNK